MPQTYEVTNVGVFEFPDDMSEQDIYDEINNQIIPNAGDPDPEDVAARPDLFPDIDRGSFFGGLGSGAERLGRVPEAVGAGVFRSQEELDDLKAQMAEENNQQRYRATLDDVTGQFDKGNYLQAAGTLFGDVLPQTLGESLPAMGVVSAGAVGGAKLGALAGTAGGPLAPVTAPIGALIGGIAGGVLAGLPNFFGMNVERQIEANEITDPDEIQTVKATAAAAAQSGLEYLTLRAFNLIPGARKIGETSISKLVGNGVEKLGTVEGLKIASKAAVRGGLTEAATEVGQQGLERLQAGLDVGNPEAIKEYIEAAVLGGLLGVGIGGTVSGGMDIRSTKKGIDETYRMLANRDMESREQQRREAEDLAVYTGAIPDPTLDSEGRPVAPYGYDVDGEPIVALLGAQPGGTINPNTGKPFTEADQTPQLKVTPVNGDPIESETAVVEELVNATEAQFNDRQTERLIKEAMDPKKTGLSPRQKKALKDLEVAREALRDDTYSLETLESTAPNIAGAVLEIEAGRADITNVDQQQMDLPLEEQQGQLDLNLQKTQFTAKELKNAAKARGVDPEIAVEEIQALRSTRRPVTDTLKGIRKTDITDLAREKNIETKDSSFDKLVKYVTGANSLKEADPFELTLMKETLENVEPFRSEKPVKLINIPQQEYEHSEYLDAIELANSNPDKNGDPQYVFSDQVKKFGNNKARALRDEMLRTGVLRREFKTKPGKTITEPIVDPETNVIRKRTRKTKPSKTSSYVFDNRIAFLPGNVPNAQIVTAPDRKVNFEAEPLPDGKFRVVAREVEGDPDVPAFQRTVSIHGTPQSAEASIEQYQNAPENSTDVDLRGIAVMPTAREYDQWQAELRQQKYNTDVVNNIKTSLKNEVELRGLQKAGISVEVVESLGAIGEGTIDGKYADGVITLALDAATVDAESSDVESVRIEKIMKNLASVLSHEQIHALKEMGQISDSDYSLLVRQAAIKKRPDSTWNSTNNPNWTYLDDAKASHAGVRNTKGEPLTQEELEEEAIAEMFRDWSNDPRTITGKPASIFRRILKFITTLGGFLQAQNVRSVNDIFTDIQKGDFTQAEINKDAAGIQEENPSFSIAPPANIPKNTVKAYKLFRINPARPGELFPLFVDADTPVPQGVWVDATDGGYSFVGKNGKPYVPAKTGSVVEISKKTARELYRAGLTTKPDVKTFKGVALRPGWHAGDVPVAKHIGPEPKENGKKTKKRGADQVWAEVEMPADVDWQTVANSKVEYNKETGEPIISSMDINDEIPFGGHYRYKTTPNMAGDWMIAGSVKVNRVLSDAEAQAIRDESGIIDPKTGEILQDPPRMGVPFDGKFSIAQPYSFTIEVKGKPEEVRFASGLTAAVNRPANPMQRSFANGYKNIMSGQQKNKFATFAKGEYYRAGQEEARLAKPEATQVEIPGEMQRYAVDAIRPGKPTITRYIMARSFQDAQAQVSNSQTFKKNLREGTESSSLSGYLGQGASELTNLRLDDPATAQSNIIDSVVPRNKRYAVDAVRPNQSTVTRYFFAKDDEDAQNVAASPSANQGASELTNLRLDDPDVVQDMEAPKFSIRRWRRVLDLDEYQEAVVPVPINPLRQNPNWGENTRGLAWLDNSEPLEIVLLKGIDIRGAGFGRDHIIAKADRFGGRQIMGEKLRAMLANSSDQNSPNHRIKPYKSKEPIFDAKGLVETKDDYQMTWRDPEDGQIYVLGLEKYSSNNIKRAAITTFYPQDREDGANMGMIASDNDVAQYMAERDASRARYSIAYGVKPDGTHDAMISPRFPTTKQAQENALTDHLQVGLEAMRSGQNYTSKGAADKFTNHMNLLLDYPGFTASSTDPDVIAQEFIDFAKSNLLWLYDQVEASTRDRSRQWYSGGRKLVTKIARKHNIPDQAVAAVMAGLSPQKDWYQNASLAERLINVHMRFSSGNMAGFLPDNRMINTARRIYKGDKYKELRLGIMKKSYSELETPLEKAMWVRTYDEAYNDRGFRKLTPEGEFIGEAKGKVAWGSNVEISKGTAALMDPSFENITTLMGERNKIRSFYNNLLTPDAMEGDVTIDTHAVAAALLRALSGNSIPVSHNFASSPPKAKQPEGFVASKADNNTGAHGLYGLFADAYRAAAAERGILPREMQSITWEAVRGLFTAKFKGQRKNVDAIDNIWRSYEAGELSLDDTRKLITETAGDINDPTWLNPGSEIDAKVQNTSYLKELDGDSVPGRSAGGVGTRSGPTGRTDEAGRLEVDRQGRIITPRYSIVKMAPPTNSEAFAEYSREVSPAFKNPDGSPKPLFTGTQHVFDEWAMNHTTDATFASESPAFAEFWAKEFADDINDAAPDSITVETATGQKVTIPQNEPIDVADLTRKEIDQDAEKMGTTLIIPLYSGAKKVWDFENPADLQAAREFLEKQPLIEGTDDIEFTMAGMRRGDWNEIEDNAFIQDFLKPNYDGFSIIEGNSWADRGAKNWGFFNKEDLKSVFNPDFDRTNEKFSIAPPKSFEEEVYEQLTEREVTGLKALVNKAKKLYKQQLLPGGLLPDEISELKIYRDNNFNIAEDTVARTLTSLNGSLKKAYGKRWYERMTPEQNQEIDRFLHGDNTVRLPEPVKVAVMKMRQDIDNLSKDYVAILQNDIIQMTASGDPEAAARARALQDIIIGNQGKYVTRSYKAFDDPYWYTNVPPDVVNNATRYIMAENGGDVKATKTLMAVLLKGEKSAYGGMESLIKEGTLGARDLSILIKRKEIAPEIRALLGEYTDPKINYTRTMLKMSRLIWNTNFLKDVQKIGMREGWLTAEQDEINTDAMAGTGSEVLAPLNGLYTTPEVKQAFKDALGKSSSSNWMNHLIGLNGVVKAGKVLYSPATQIRNFVSAPFFVIQSGSMNINEIQKAATTAWEFAVSKDGNTTEYFRELTRLGVTYNTPNVGMLQDALADGDQVFAALNQVGVNKFGETADQVVTTGKKVNNIIQNFYRIGDDFWKIVAYESQLAQYRKAKPNMPLEEVKKIVAKRVRDSIPTYSLIGSGMRKLSRFPVLGTFVAFSSEVIRTSVGNFKIMVGDFADPDLVPLARKRAIGMVIAHSWAYAAGALGMSLLGITDDEEESVRKLGSPWSENANLLFWGRDEKGNMETVDLSFVDPYNLFHKPINALMRKQPWGDSLVGAVGEVLLPFFGPEIASGALFEVVTNRKLRTNRPIYNEDAPGLDQSEEIALHLIKSMGPGVFRNIEGVSKAIKGDRSPSGKEYKLKDELLASMGIKFSTFDPKLSLYFRTSDFKEVLGNANSILYKVASNVNPVSDEDLEEAFNSANDARIRGYNDMLKMVNSARLSGVSDSELRRVLSASKVSKAYINRLVRGKEAPKWRIGKTFLKGATKRARILLDRETANDLRKRRNMVRGISRDQQ